MTEICFLGLASGDLAGRETKASFPLNCCLCFEQAGQRARELDKRWQLSESASVVFALMCKPKGNNMLWRRKSKTMAVGFPLSLHCVVCRNPEALWQESD